MDPVLTMHRPATGAPIAGVCAAIADRTGIDPVIIRVAAALLAVSSGIGVVLYLVAWLLIPREGQDRGILLTHLPALARAPRWVLIVTIAVAVVLVASALGQVAPTTFFPPLILVALWYFGVHRPGQSRRSATTSAWSPPGGPGASVDPRSGAPAPSWPGPTAPPQEPAAAGAGATAAGESDTPTVERPVGPLPGNAPFGADRGRTAARTGPDPRVTAYLAYPDPIGLYAPPRAPSVRRARRVDPQRAGKRTLGMLTLTVVGLLWTGLALLGALHIVAVPAWAWTVGALLVVGCALIVAGWVGRPRGMVAAAVVLAIAATVSTVQAAVPLRVASTAHVAYSSVEDLPAQDSWDVGEATVDLSDLNPVDDATYTARMGAGTLTIVTPPDTHVVVTGEVSMGRMQLGTWASTSSEPGSRTQVISEGSRDGATIEIHASTDVGALVVVSG